MTVLQVIRDDDRCEPPHEIATTYAASIDKAAMVARSPVGPDGRSEWVWVVLANGDVLLACFPHGDTFERIKDEVQP